MESAAYRRLLLRLIAVPIIALALLAALMVYGFREVERNARRVDRADQILSLANNAFKLMVDQETGLRGFLLTHDQRFLQPYRDADQQLDAQFSAIFRLIEKDPRQTASLNEVRAQSRAWQQNARTTIAQQALTGDPVPMMLQRKQQMDQLREWAEVFLSAEAAIRADRSSIAVKLNRLSLSLLISLTLLIGLLLAWIMRRLVGQITRVYEGQLSEVRRRGEESYAREQWLNTTLRSIGDAVIACDPDGKVVFMNSVAERLTGWNEVECLGQPLVEISRSSTRTRGQWWRTRWIK